MKEIMERGDKLQQLENTSEQMFVDAKNLSGQAATVPKNMKKNSKDMKIKSFIKNYRNVLRSKIGSVLVTMRKKNKIDN
ncbi:hypothetical protein QR98_0040670 [Sarcoptes scabiei]|uniref:V-SNARE coiled-coil homology domain-containing protein n=1 Tax=Sarcoptes scabiei TaxID=52283 RepID=A0A132A3N4_SARSC|nr:hypothetical protein QR98_0040670 [Sarcoptes scabiei]